MTTPGDRRQTLEWLDLIARGDSAAFGRFYDRYAAFVFSFARRVLRSNADAEDLLQEVFLQVWKQAGAYRPDRGAPEAWLSTITRTRAIDRLRSIRRKNEVPGDFTDHEAAGASDSAARETERSEARLSARGLLERLTPDQRQALELAYYEGLSHTEIARRTGLPLGTVKTRMRAGLKALRRAMGGIETNTETDDEPRLLA